MFPAPSDLSHEPPFVILGDVSDQVAESQSSLDPRTICPVHSETGKCRHGFKCRFLGAHVKTAENGLSDELSLVVDGGKAAHAVVSAAELNFVDPDVRKQLRTRKVATFHSLCGWNSADTLRSGIVSSILHMHSTRGRYRTLT